MIRVAGTHGEIPRPPLTSEQQTLVEGATRFAHGRAIYSAYRISRGNTRRAQELIDEFDSAAYHGLCIAATKFKPELGFTFLTYAAWWIRQMITRHHQSLHPFGASAARKKVSWRPPRSIGQPLSAADDRLLDVPDRPQPERDPSQIGPELEQVLRFIPTERAKAMIVLHLVDGMTLDEVGSIFGVTKERVRQIVAKATARLQVNRHVRAIALKVLGPERMTP